MTFDIVLAGVGGQGVLALANLIAGAALDDGWFVKQSEVHGMSQRGGAVTAHLRLARRPVASELIALGTGSMVLSLEPMEGLRYLSYLTPGAPLVTSIDPVTNISNYPLEEVLALIEALPGARPVPALALARKAGLVRATNMVMAGAAAPLLPIPTAALEQRIRSLFAAKGAHVIDCNLAAFHAGWEASCTATR